MHSHGLWHADHLFNLADLLWREVLVESVPIGRLGEARAYAQRALAILEPLDVSSRIWDVLAVLARIADLEGHTEAARDYRRRARQTYAAFVGNHHYIEQEFGSFIAAVVDFAKGDMQLRQEIEASLLEAETNGWNITTAIHSIWAGERDQHALIEDLNGREALLIMRILETLQTQEGRRDERTT